MTLLFYTLAFLTVGVMLLVFAGNPAKLKKLQPTLATKRILKSRELRLSVGVLYFMVCVIVWLVMRMIQVFGVLVLASHESEETPNDYDEDFRYKHEGETYYTHSTGDVSNRWY